MIDYQPLVYQHFYTHPIRLERAKISARKRGYRIIDTLSGEVFVQARYFVAKSRPVSDELLSKFSKLNGIIIQGREPWMIEDQSKFINNFRFTEFDRGFEVAEHAMALMNIGLKNFHNLSSWKVLLAPIQRKYWFKTVEATEKIGAHNWANMKVDTLDGKIIGFVGYGAIGRQIHNRIMGYNVRVKYFHQRRFPLEMENRLSLEYTQLKKMVKICQVIFLQIPLTAETKNMISPTIIKNFHPDLVLINCGRAAVIDEVSLLNALKRRKLKFYGADVFWREPMPLLSPYRFLNNCCITPHMAEGLKELRKPINDQVLDQIDYIEGKKSNH